MRTNKKLLLICYFLSTIIPLFSKAQVGIGTKNPQGLFHIDASKNNSTTGFPSTNQQQDDFVILNDGKIGIGTLSPSTRLDLRNPNNTNNVIAIGYTDASASEAGAGAIRYYDVSGGLLQVSDGITWSNLPSSPQKSFVAAHIEANNNTIQFSSTASDVTNWSEIKDFNNDFNANTGEFIAPRDGVYNVSFTYDFIQGSIIEGSRVEAQFIKNNSTVLIKCLKTFGKSTRTAQAGGICNASVTLLKGEALKVRLAQSVSTSARGLRSTTIVTNPFFGFNNISIVEL